MIKMRILIFSLFLLIPLSLQAELLEQEDENMKCLGQDLLGTGELNGLVHCINKQSNWNYYYDYNDDGFIKDDIIIQIPDDRSFIIFSEYKDETNNGMQFGIRKNSNIWLSEFLDGKKHGLETTHNYDSELTRIREYWDDKISETTPTEMKQINHIDNDFINSSYVAYLTDENDEFIPNTFYYESDTKLDRANNMLPLETTTHFAKMNNTSDMNFFGHGLYKVNENTYYLNWDKKDESGNPTQITEEEVDDDVFIFNLQLQLLNSLKKEQKEKLSLFRNRLMEKYSVDINNTFDEVVIKIDDYISKNLVANAHKEIKLKCFLAYYGANNDQEINFFYTLKNETLYDEDGKEFYLKEKNDSLYVFGHKDDDLFEYRLNRNNLEMVMIYNLGKSKGELSCSTSAPLL